MKRILFAAGAGLLFAGCADLETNSVSQLNDGTPVYGLNEQPQTSVAGEGSLLAGSYDPRQIPTGQFTGQERTAEVVGQQPTLPREADARELDPNGRGQIRTETGTLSRDRISPAIPAVVGSALFEEPRSPAEESAADVRPGP